MGKTFLERHIEDLREQAEDLQETIKCTEQRIPKMQEGLVNERKTLTEINAVIKILEASL